MTRVGFHKKILIAEMMERATKIIPIINKHFNPAAPRTILPIISRPTTLIFRTRIMHNLNNALLVKLPFVCIYLDTLYILGFKYYLTCGLKSIISHVNVCSNLN